MTRIVGLVIFLAAAFIAFLIGWLIFLDSLFLVAIMAGFIITTVLLGVLVSRLSIIRVLGEATFRKFIGWNPRKLRILLLGLGGSGKTSIIRRLLTGEFVYGEHSTNRFDIYEAKLQIGDSIKSSLTVSMIDHKGQQASQLFIEGPVNYPGFFGLPGSRLINAVIIVVDLFPEFQNDLGQPLQEDAIVELHQVNAESLIASRVAEHLGYTTPSIIQMVFSLADNLIGREQ